MTSVDGGLVCLASWLFAVGCMEKSLQPKCLHGGNGCCFSFWHNVEYGDES